MSTSSQTLRCKVFIFWILTHSCIAEISIYGSVIRSLQRRRVPCRQHYHWDSHSHWVTSSPTRSCAPSFVTSRGICGSILPPVFAYPCMHCRSVWTLRRAARWASLLEKSSTNRLACVPERWDTSIFGDLVIHQQLWLSSSPTDQPAWWTQRCSPHSSGSVLSLSACPNRLSVSFILQEVTCVKILNIMWPVYTFLPFTSLCLYHCRPVFLSLVLHACFFSKF